MLRVFICGAHSTGKTTLLNQLLHSEPDQDLHAVNEVARKVIAKNGWELRDFDPSINPDIFYELQVKILQAQIRIDAQYSIQNRSYISDRGLDPIIYCKLYLGEAKFKQILSTNEARECIERHRAANTLTIVLTPHSECLREDGVRISPKVEELHKFTELLQEFLRANSILFETISELDLDRRTSVLKSLIQEKKQSIL